VNWISFRLQSASPHDISREQVIGSSPKLRLEVNE
jgi:hypothetical protein